MYLCRFAPWHQPLVEKRTFHHLELGFEGFNRPSPRKVYRMYTVHTSLVPQESLRWSIPSHGTESSSGNKSRSELLWNWGRATAVMMKSEVGQGQLQAFQLLFVAGMEGDYTNAFCYHLRCGSRISEMAWVSWAKKIIRCIGCFTRRANTMQETLVWWCQRLTNWFATFHYNFDRKGSNHTFPW